MSNEQFITQSPKQEIPYGYCHCGCGQKTTICSKTVNTRGLVKGEPRKFISHHNKKGNLNPHWRGGRNIDKGGYPMIHAPQHHRAVQTYVREHILIAEKALGKPLPPKASIHHHGPVIDQCLVICQNWAYHMLIQKRTRAYVACGHADWNYCHHCKLYDRPENLKKVTTVEFYYHPICNRIQARKFRTSRKNH